MSVSYLNAQKQHVRITLDLNVLSDFNARDIDFEKLFKLEPNESVEVYVEEFDRYWQELCALKYSDVTAVELSQ